MSLCFPEDVWTKIKKRSCYGSQRLFDDCHFQTKFFEDIYLTVAVGQFRAGLELSQNHFSLKSVIFLVAFDKIKKNLQEGIYLFFLKVLNNSGQIISHYEL